MLGLARANGSDNGTDSAAWPDCNGEADIAMARLIFRVNHPVVQVAGHFGRSCVDNTNLRLTCSGHTSRSCKLAGGRGKTNIFLFSDFLFSDFFFQGLGVRV